MKFMTISEAYLKKIKSSSSETSWKWLNQIYSNLGPNFNPNHFAAAYSQVRRRLGNLTITFNPGDKDNLFGSKSLAPYKTTLDEWGRACLLLRAIECLTQEESTVLIRETYQRGDIYEKQALLHTLPVLPNPSQYLAIAVEACRSNVHTVFEAIACNNAYPFQYFPGPNFNQMVLKALFIGSSLRSIVGLQNRLNPELRQMVADFVSERRMAGRPLPEDIGLITPNLLSPKHEAV
jgi:hypothetical protein